MRILEIGEGTAWPVIVAISFRDLKTPGTVNGDGLNIVGCAPLDFYLSIGFSMIKG